MQHTVSRLLVMPLLAVTMAADWPRFRGPGGLGVSAERNLPTEWSSTRNVVWKANLPGPGTSSPVVVADRVYVTAYSGYGMSVEAPGDVAQLVRHVVCLDRATGRIVWQKPFPAGVKESEYAPGNSSWHGYASSTPVADDAHLYVFFGASGVFCLRLGDGEVVWKAGVGNAVTGWGSGNSPVLHENLLLVNAAVESGRLVALDKATGAEVWQADVGRGARNTPNLVPLPAGGVELVFSLPGEPQGRIVGLDPRTGVELWSARGIRDGGYVCPSVVAHDGVVYAIGGRKNTAVAVRAGGRGEVSETHVLWTVAKGSNVASPAYHEGRLYWMHEKQGTFVCLDAATGDVVFEERVEPRPGIVYSSVTVADGKVFATSQHDGTFVFEAGPTFRPLAHNTLADGQRANASLAVDRGRLLLRDDGAIWCLGTP
mgnify:CR=1 FL=1